MEYDCGDFDRHVHVPDEYGTWCTDEVASHSRAGVGADPSLKWNLFGGEFQFTPQDSEQRLFESVCQVLSLALRNDLYYPGTIHMHIRVPWLLEHPEAIKDLVKWTQLWWPFMSSHIYKSESPTYLDGEYNNWLYDCNMQVKRQKYPPSSIQRMMGATTAREIALALHNWPSEWKNEWHQEVPPDFVKRPGVNFGHLAINETIEFRCFTTTTTPHILKNIIEFPAKFISAWAEDIIDPVRIARFVQFQDNAYQLPDTKGMAEATSGYFKDTKRGILAALVNKQITVADLNYPDYWIRKGFE